MLAAAHDLEVTERAGTDRCRLGEDAEAPEGSGDAYHLVDGLGDQLAREPVEPGNTSLAVSTGFARVGRSVLAGLALVTRAADGCRHEIAAREPVPVALDEGEDLVSEHELVGAVRGNTEEALRDLSVGAADADLQRPEQHGPGLRARLGHLRDAGRVGCTGDRHQGLHRPTSGVWDETRRPNRTDTGLGGGSHSATDEIPRLDLAFALDRDRPPRLDDELVLEQLLGRPGDLDPP